MGAQLLGRLTMGAIARRPIHAGRPSRLDDAPESERKGTVPFVPSVPSADGKQFIEDDVVQRGGPKVMGR